MAKYVITIARQFGSLGRPIARRMSEMLGIEYYDRDIVDAVAAKTELPRSTVIEVDEKINTGFFRMMFPLGQNNLQVQNQVFQTQRNYFKSGGTAELYYRRKMFGLYSGKCGKSSENLYLCFL
ncbi:MAG: cytidylate kinase family protein [Frisingicoccus sp.]